MNIRYIAVKPMLDFVFSIVFLFLLSPLLALIALWIKLNSPGPVLFRQERVGKDGKLFLIYKFRTMVVDAEKLGIQLTLKEDPRITRCGKFLRTYKLDELPQLVNIFRGEMSFVGPRPLVPLYLQMYNGIEKKVFSVRPGLTDEASIKYRNEDQLLEDADNAESLYIQEILPDKLQMNLMYVQKVSFLQDLQIIIRTFAAILKKNQDPTEDRGKEY